MPAYFAPNALTCTIDGNSYVGFLKGWNHTIGARPSEAQVLLAEGTVEDASYANSTFKGKTAVLAYDGTTIITGHVYRVQKRQADRSVVVHILDKRWLINKTYIGADSLETLDANGLPTSFGGLSGYGADIIFNAGGKPNKSGSGFVYPGAYNSQSGAYWTYADILGWIWDNYITDVTKPTIPTTGGLERESDELSFLGVPVGDAIDQVFARTRAQWYLDGDGAAHIFDIDNPVTTKALTFPDPDSPAAASTYNLSATTEDFIVEEAIDTAGAQIDIIGGKQVREITLNEGDFSIDQHVDMNAAPGWVKDVPTSIWQNFNIDWYSNASGGAAGGVQRFTLNGSAYEGHKIGTNLAADNTEAPYSMLPNLLIARTRSGGWATIDADGEVEPVSCLEYLKFQYPDGASVDMKGGYVTGRWRSSVVSAPSSEFLLLPYKDSWRAPLRWSVAMECAYRAHVSSTGTVTGAPDTLRRAVLREEFVHKTREDTKVIVPVIAFYNVGSSSFTIIEPFGLPPGSTRDYETLIDAPLVPDIFTATLQSGVVVDGIGPLNEIKSLVDDNVGKPSVNGTGAFPSFQVLNPGTRITATPNNYGLSGEEIVTAVSFNDQNQRLEFSFANKLGSDITARANAFVNKRAFRRPL